MQKKVFVWNLARPATVTGDRGLSGFMLRKATRLRAEWVTNP